MDQGGAMGHAGATAADMAIAADMVTAATAEGTAITTGTAMETTPTTAMSQEFIRDTAIEVAVTCGTLAPTSADLPEDIREEAGAEHHEALAVADSAAVAAM